MAQKFLTPIDLNKNELQNWRIHNLATAPSSPAIGQTYYDTALLYQRTWDGTVWQRGSFATDPFARANHTGTQLSATISDLAATVQAYRLDQFAVPTASLNINSQRLTSVLDPTSAQDAATKNYVDSVIQAKNYKDSVRVATTAALPTNTGSAGVLTASSVGVLTVDGVATALNDRILVQNEATAANNGIYVVTTAGAAGAAYVLTRAADANTSAKVLAGMTLLVDEGTANHDAQFTLTTDNPITLNTTALAFAKTVAAGGTSYSAGNGLSLTTTTFAVVAGNGIIADGTSTRVDPAVVARKATGLIGDGSSTSIAFTHSLGNQNVVTQLFDASTNALVQCDITNTSTSVVTLAFAVAPASNAYRVVVVG